MNSTDRNLAGWAALTNHRGLLRVSGPDARRFLHNFCTNDIQGLEPGDAVEAFFTTAQGRTIAFAWIVCTGEDEFLVDTGLLPPEQLLGHLKTYWISERMSLEDCSGPIAHFLVIAPEDERPQVPEAGICLARGGYPGTTQAWHLFAPAEKAPDLEAELRNSAPPSLSEEDLDTARILNRWPEAGKEVTDEHFPQEFRRDETAISFTKGCYLGQEVVSRIRTYGHVNRYLVLLQLDEGPVQSGEQLTANGDTVGQITSVTPRLVGGRRYALAFVRRGYDGVGTVLRLQTGAEGVIVG